MVSKGVIFNLVIWLFYIGVVILVVLMIIMIVWVWEYDFVIYVKYYGIDESVNKFGGNWLVFLKKVLKVFWLVVLV